MFHNKMNKCYSSYCNRKERLQSAVLDSNFQECFDSLMDGARAHIVVCGGRTAIGVAAEVGNAEILRLLIQSCEDPDFRINRANPIEIELDTPPDGMDKLEWEDEFTDTTTDTYIDDKTRLYYYYAKTFEQTGAIINNMSELSARLNEPIPDVHQADEELLTPLHYAANYGRLECAKLLLLHGADVDAVDSNGYTALHYGIKHCAVMQLLLKHGANANLKTISTCETALHRSIREKSEPVASFLLQHGVKINETDNYDQTPLMCAIEHCLPDIAFQLLDCGARINMQDKGGGTALYYAVRQNLVNVAKRLLERGARRIASQYLLHICVEYNLAEMLFLLLKHGESLNVRNNKGYTPIYIAIFKCRVDLLAYLLEVIALEEFCGKTTMDIGQNELMVAVEHVNSLEGFKQIARILYDYSSGRWRQHKFYPVLVDGSFYAPSCNTALECALMRRKLHFAEFLIKEGISQDCSYIVLERLIALMPPGFPELAKLLVHTGYKWPSGTSSLFMRQLYSSPLKLTALTRIAIRNQLTSNLFHLVRIQPKYRATKLESSLSFIIKELELPSILKDFLIDFHDCPNVISKLPKHWKTYYQGALNYSDSSNSDSD